MEETQQDTEKPAKKFLTAQEIVDLLRKTGVLPVEPKT